ncbi:STAS domain-containing protein [Xaviernesmea oryzae]
MMSKTNTAKTLPLAPVLDLNAASELHEKLMGLRGSDIVIDASKVERVGALCVQVLMAGAKSWQADNLSFVISQASDAFSKTTQLIGVNVDHLMAKEN